MRRYQGVLAIACLCLQGTLDCTTQTPTPAMSAQDAAVSGLTAFQACDLRTASEDFSQAHTLDPSRPDYALAYALSTLAVLPEDPAVTAVLVRLGFQGQLDSSLLWGPGGVLAQAETRKATCQSILDFLRDGLHYPAAEPNGPSAASLVDSTLTGNDIVAAAAALSPRLQSLVDALDQGAAGAASTSFTGGCGIGNFTIEPPELYAIAGILESIVATIQAAQGYDWGVPVGLALDWTGREQEFADSLNAHVFHLANAAAIESARPLAQRAVSLFQKGAAAAAGINTSPASALFNWADAPPNVVADIQTLTSGVQAMVTNAGLQPIPFFSPALMIDARSFFDNPVDLSQVTPPIWQVIGTPGGPGGLSVQSMTTNADSLIQARFSPFPTNNDWPNYTLTLSSRWQTVSSDTAVDVFDPNRRWEAIVSCN